MGNATTAHVLAGKTFTNSTGSGLTGGMTSVSSGVKKTFSPSTSSQTWTINTGYHGGDTTVTVNAITGTKVLSATNSASVDLGGAYRYVNTSAVYNAGSNSAHQTTTYALGTKASAAASTYDMGNTNKYRYINATAAWNKASSTGYTNGRSSANVFKNLTNVGTFGERTTKHYTDTSYSTYLFLCTAGKRNQLINCINSTTSATVVNFGSYINSDNTCGWRMFSIAMPSGGFYIKSGDAVDFNVFGVKA